MACAKNEKIAVLVSGGVDSSLALTLLKQDGHDVTAFYLKIWLEDELSFLGQCPWEEDLGFVKQLCDQLQVPLKIINLQKEYLSKVTNLALAQIKQGLTPNPDIFCNSLIKFGAFFEEIGDGFNIVATGHYAKVVHHDNGTSTLEVTPDKIKDQTYFLAKLTQTQISKTLFPLGDFTKSQVRELAQKHNIPAKDRKDSQGLCFLGKIKFEDFIRENIGENPGDFVEIETGKILGQHRGFWFHTLGQRRGIGLSGGPWYVAKKDPAKNIVYISNNYFSEDKARNSMSVGDFNWINQAPAPGEVTVKLRHGPETYQALFLPSQDGQTANLTLNQRDQGITPGQFVVFYQNDTCLGSAMILQEL